MKEDINYWMSKCASLQQEVDVLNEKLAVIKWQTGTPKIRGEYLVCLKSGNITTDTFLAVDGLEGDWKRFNKSYVVAWCKLSDIEPYKEETE